MTKAPDNQTPHPQNCGHAPGYRCSNCGNEARTLSVHPLLHLLLPDVPPLGLHALVVLVSLYIFIPWPTFPTVTATGKPSKAIQAGKHVPWLSMNNVRRMHSGVYHSIAALWREAAEREAVSEPVVKDHPIIVDLTLYKRTASEMDAAAVIEGAKPCIDGLVNMGVLVDDGPKYVLGFTARTIKAQMSEPGLMVGFRRPQ